MGYYWVYNGSRAYVTNINQLFIYIYIICNWDVSANGFFLREEITNQWILMLFLWYGMKTIYKFPCHIWSLEDKADKATLPMGIKIVLQGWTRTKKHNVASKVMLKNTNTKGDVCPRISFFPQKCHFHSGKSWSTTWAPVAHSTSYDLTQMDRARSRTKYHHSQKGWSLFRIKPSNCGC